MKKCICKKPDWWLGAYGDVCDKCDGVRSLLHWKEMIKKYGTQFVSDRVLNA